MLTQSKLGIVKPKYPFVGLMKGEDPISLSQAAEPVNAGFGFALLEKSNGG